MVLARNVRGVGKELLIVMVRDLDGEPWLRFGRFLLVVETGCPAATAEVIAAARERLGI
jgi:hypothetical protein